MALILGDRVKETSTTTGSSDYTLGGAETGFRTFSTVIGNTNTTYYCCTDGVDFEVGVGTYASSGNTLSRTAILESSIVILLLFGQVEQEQYSVPNQPKKLSFLMQVVICLLLIMRP